MSLLDTLKSKLENVIGIQTSTDIVDLLTAQHAEVDTLFEALRGDGGNRRALIVELGDKLGAHAGAEEAVFYPAILDAATRDMLFESVEEHLAIKRALADLLTMTLDADEFRAKVTVLEELVSHHAHEEEEKSLFPLVRKERDANERAAIGNEYMVKYAELLAAKPHLAVPSQTDRAAKLTLA